MTLFWHTYVLSYLGLGLISLLIIIRYASFCGAAILEDNDNIILTIACILIWPIFSGAMLYSFYKSHLSYIMIVSLKDIPHAWKAAVENERNRNSNNNNGEYYEESISTVQRTEIKSLREEISQLKQVNTEVLNELINIKESVPGSGQQRSMKKLANIIRK